MAQIFAMLKSPQSFFKAMGLPNGSALTSSVTVGDNLDDNSTKLIYRQGGLNLRQRGFAPITVNCNSQKLHIKFKSTGWFNTAETYWWGALQNSMRGQVHKLLKLVDSSGVCKVSFGNKPSEYYDTANLSAYTASVKDATGFSLFSFGGANQYRPSAISATHYIYPNMLGYPFNVTDVFEIIIDLSAAGQRSVILKANGIKVAELSDAQLPADFTSVAKVQLLDPADLDNSSVINYKVSCRIEYLLVTDAELVGYDAISLVPSAFGATNDFTGDLSNITSPIQDSLFIATSAETGQTVDLLFNFPENLQTIDKLDLYFQGKYVQELGISAKFSVALHNKVTGELLTTPQVITIPANVSDTVYATDLVASWVTNLVTSSKFTLADLNNSVLKISLVEV